MCVLRILKNYTSGKFQVLQSHSIITQYYQLCYHLIYRYSYYPIHSSCNWKLPLSPALHISTTFQTLTTTKHSQILWPKVFKVVTGVNCKYVCNFSRDDLIRHIIGYIILCTQQLFLYNFTHKMWNFEISPSLIGDKWYLSVHVISNLHFPF